MQPHNFLSTDAAGGTPTRRHALGRLPTPPPLPENLLLRLHRKLPSEPPASTQEVSESENPPHIHPIALSDRQGDNRCKSQCSVQIADASFATRRPTTPIVPTFESRLDS